MRFSGTDKSYSEIATELGGVGAIVEPTFMHVGNKLQLHARLIEPSDGKVLWAGVFDKTMDDILVIQSELAKTVAREIRATVTAPEQKRLSNARPVDPDLYRLYLQGISHIARRTLADFRRSTELFMQVLEKDPNNALAYAGLSESYAILPFYEGGQPAVVFPKAKAAALKALELDNSLAEAHTALAFVLFYGDWDFPAAEKELLEAIDLKPSYVVAHHWYAEYLSAMGRHEQALAEIKRAQELVPFRLSCSSLEVKTVIWRDDTMRSSHSASKRLSWIQHMFWPMLISSTRTSARKCMLRLQKRNGSEAQTPPDPTAWRLCIRKWV